MVICEYYLYILEVLPTGEGDMLCLSKNSLSTGEVGSSSAHLPQNLFPLCSLQYKTQVSFAVFSSHSVMSEYNQNHLNYC